MPKVKHYESVDQATLRMIGRHLGMGAILCRFGDVNPEYGAGIIDNSTKCLWTRDKCRVTIQALPGGGHIADVSPEPDPDCPGTETTKGTIPPEVVAEWNK